MFTWSLNVTVWLIRTLPKSVILVLSTVLSIAYTDVLPYRGKILEIVYILYVGLCTVGDVFIVLFWI